MGKSNINEEIKKELSSQKVKNYSYLILFFLAFSFFFFFGIRPSVLTIVTLINEQKKLSRIDTQYETTIGQIVSIQTELQEVQGKLYLLAQALPMKPNISKVLQDIQTSGNKNSVRLVRLGVDNISLVKTKKESVYKISISMESISSYDNLVGFINDLRNQRRLKSIEKFDITQQGGSATSSNLNAIIKVVGYYL